MVTLHFAKKITPIAVLIEMEKSYCCVKEILCYTKKMSPIALLGASARILPVCFSNIAIAKITCSDFVNKFPFAREMKVDAKDTKVGPLLLATISSIVSIAGLLAYTKLYLAFIFFLLVVFPKFVCSNFVNKLHFAWEII